MKVVLSLFIAGLFAISGISVAAINAEDGSGLILSKCSACHSLKRVCRGLGKKDLAAWTKTNKRMAAMGMSITDGELELVNNYLANAKPGEGPVCK
ncbi:hypothetical protein [Maridesulfovibrio zosterae]|uniref:hypothetical protein n=1 Tax=Maridesulfovibrio zosterae TaxID=82171 RepID=UPI0004103EF8|nr:hypothetical protein [Maridesulfovibrio zosterae]